MYDKYIRSSPFRECMVRVQSLKLPLAQLTQIAKSLSDTQNPKVIVLCNLLLNNLLTGRTKYKFLASFVPVVTSTEIDWENFFDHNFDVEAYFNKKYKGNWDHAVNLAAIRSGPSTTSVPMNNCKWQVIAESCINLLTTTVWSTYNKTKDKLKAKVTKYPKELKKVKLLQYILGFQCFKDSLSIYDKRELAKSIYKELQSRKVHYVCK